MWLATRIKSAAVCCERANQAISDWGLGEKETINPQWESPHACDRRL
ncbi:MAG TPA: hypothetical protein VGD05_06980 [Pyrinomonadaceae bacterium]